MIDEDDPQGAPKLPGYDDVESRAAPGIQTPSAAPVTRAIRTKPATTGADAAPAPEVHEEAPAPPVAATTPPRPAAPPSSTPATLASAAEAVHVGLNVRTRYIALGTFGAGAAALATVPVLARDTVGRLLLGTSLIGVMVSGGWIWKLLGEAPELTDRKVLPPWILLSLAIVGLNAGYGAYSPAPMVTIFSVYYVTQRHGLPVSLTVYAMCGGLHAALVIAIMAGMRDPGIITSDLEPIQMVLGEALGQLMLVGAFWVSRKSYVATNATLEELQRAAYLSAQREALLIEAREELERAMQLGGPGRFTDQVLGSFRLGPVIGRGGMGEVYEATRVEGGEVVAVKLLRMDALGNTGTVARFLREAVATSALKSPHVVRVLEIGDETAPLPYIAMERLVGNDLAYHLRARPRLPTVELIDLMRQVANGVDAAHSAGIVHRDLKPQNLFLHQPTPLPAPGIWKILDFGVSKLRDQGSTLSQGHIIGTPAYMAPEQVRGQDVDNRTDVYALGVVAFRTLTGELPFRGRDTAELLYNVVHAPLPRASRRTPDLPPGVDEVLLSAMARQPRDRFDTAGELAQALAAALR